MVIEEQMIPEPLFVSAIPVQCDLIGCWFILGQILPLDEINIIKTFMLLA